MDWKELGWNALTAGVLAVGGLVALANGDKLQDLSKKKWMLKLKMPRKNMKKFKNNKNRLLKKFSAMRRLLLI